MRRDHRRILARFRSCNLPLAVETGRYTKPTPIDERLCKYCDESSIEDETHFLIECELYSDIRYDLFQIATAENRNFPSFSTDEKLVYSKISILRPPFGLPKSGLISEVVLISNIIL